MKLVGIMWGLRAKGNGCVVWAVRGRHIEVTFKDGSCIAGTVDEANSDSVRIRVNGTVIIAPMEDIVAVDTDEGFCQDDGVEDEEE